MRLTKFSRLNLISLFLLTLLLSLSFSLQSSSTTAAQKVRSLAFSAQQGQGATFRGSLFTIQANGKARRDLTPTLNNVSPTLSWSPNGQRLAFVSQDSDLYIVNANGSRLTQLLAGDLCKASSFNITWLPNSQKLLFVRSCDAASLDAPGSQSLYMSDTTSISGTKLIQRWEGWTTGTPQRNEGLGLTSNVPVSPDGKQVVFIKDKAMYKMNTDGSGLTQLDVAIANTSNDSPEWSELSWSPDGTRISRIDFFYAQERKQQIYLLNAEGTILAQTTGTETNWSNPNLVWSPDSTRVAYYQSQPELSQIDIYLLDINGGTPKNLTRKPGQYSALHWLSGGKQIACVGDRKIYSINVDGSNLTEIPIPLPVSGISAPAWTADSQQIAFSSGDAAKDNLYVVNLNGSGLIKLTNNRDINAYSPSWQP
jgi:Tol biopolymer transport system component